MPLALPLPPYQPHALDGYTFKDDKGGGVVLMLTLSFKP
jgi:hypothetical protein